MPADHGWSSLEGSHINWHGLTHKVRSAYGEVGVADPLGRLRFYCMTILLRTVRLDTVKAQVVETPVTCLECIARL